MRPYLLIAQGTVVSAAGFAASGATLALTWEELQAYAHERCDLPREADREPAIADVKRAVLRRGWLLFEQTNGAGFPVPALPAADSTRTMVRLIDGKLYDPWEAMGPAPSPETVAHGLARLCRYGGHVRRARIYSVAEHSLWVMLALAMDGLHGGMPRLLAGSLARAMRGDGAPSWRQYLETLDPARAELALCGLVHEGAEGSGLVDM
ncbi:MAG: hypothetical protein Q8S13_03585, partial [Dehalococcoidia bacterium]|nr:hypothetical protein [Dehalococcoidia bacterium]